MIDITKIESISAIWGDEHKTVVECAERIHDFMLLLKEHNPQLFSEWYEQATSLKEALELKIEITQEYFYKQVEKNWDKKKSHLGTRVALWTGNEEDGYSGEVSFSLGKHPNNPNLKNACVVSLPIKGQWAEYYNDSKNSIALIYLMKEFWKPDFLKVNGERIEGII